jgi:hypothetical protein
MNLPRRVFAPLREHVTGDGSRARAGERGRARARAPLRSARLMWGAAEMSIWGVVEGMTRNGPGAPANVGYRNGPGAPANVG